MLDLYSAEPYPNTKLLTIIVLSGIGSCCIGMGQGVSVCVSVSGSVCACVCIVSIMSLPYHVMQLLPVTRIIPCHLRHFRPITVQWPPLGSHKGVNPLNPCDSPKPLLIP